MKKIYRVFILCFIGITMLCAQAGAKQKAGQSKIGANAVVEILKAGNARFANSQLTHPNQTLERRNEVALGQAPKAVVIGCTDSRVPPEIIFDQGLGDLFVIRVAGNILNDENIGSAEYAVEHLRAPLIVVLGHKKCGAVAVAVKGGKIPGHIKNITDALMPAVHEARNEHRSGDLAEEAAHINVENVVQHLKTSDPILAEKFKKGKLKILGAYYDLDTGKVEWVR